MAVIPTFDLSKFDISFYLCRNIKKIIFVSSATMKSVLNNSGLKSSTKSKYTVIYNGLNQENKNKKKETEKKRNWKEKKKKWKEIES